MDLVTEALPVEQHKGPFVPTAQPIPGLTASGPELDDAAVRAALVNAEANNLDPMTVTLGDMANVQGQQVPAKAQPSQPANLTDIPEKFLKPDGEVDVEKLQASTRQLDEAIQRKEGTIKSVEDLWNHYKDSQKRFGAMPNVERLAVPPIHEPQAPMAPQQMSDQQLREIVARDWQQDPIATTAQLIDIAIQKRLQPFEEDKRDSSVRGNIAEVAKKDPRILQHYDAVTRKLDTSPELWRLKNPHRAAWLDVKEDLHLGEYANTQAPPSKPLSPVLGGGAPPSTPSSSAPQQSNDILSNFENIDFRNKKQEAEADAAFRAYLARSGR